MIPPFEPGMKKAASMLVKAARAAGTGRPVSTGAVLGTVMAGDDPSLWIRLDTGQEVPQCMGDALPVGTRVLAFWMNEGHDLAVIQLAEGSGAT